MDKSMDRWSPARGRIGGTPRRVAARSSPRLWSALDHTIGIIEPVETDAEDNDSKGHDQYEEHDSARDTHRRLVSFEGPRFVVPERPDRNGQGRQAAQPDAYQRVGSDKRLDDIETGQGDEDDGDREQDGAVKPVSKPRGKRRAPRR